jgi:hypothetical protein
MNDNFMVTFVSYSDMFHLYKLIPNKVSILISFLGQITDSHRDKLY